MFGSPILQRLRLEVALSLGRCTYDICNEGEGGVLAYVATPYESTGVEYLERHPLDTAVSAEIVKTTLERLRTVGPCKIDMKIWILIDLSNFDEKIL